MSALPKMMDVPLSKRAERTTSDEAERAAAKWNLLTSHPRAAYSLRTRTVGPIRTGPFRVSAVRREDSRDVSRVEEVVEKAEIWRLRLEIVFVSGWRA